MSDTINTVELISFSQLVALRGLEIYSYLDSDSYH